MSRLLFLYLFIFPLVPVTLLCLALFIWVKGTICSIFHHQWSLTLVFGYYIIGHWIFYCKNPMYILMITFLSCLHGYLIVAQFFHLRSLFPFN